MDRQSEGRALSGLVGAGPSLLGPVGAMRARDVSRPQERHAARAEEDLVVRQRGRTDREPPHATLRARPGQVHSPADLATPPRPPGSGQGSGGSTPVSS